MGGADAENVPRDSVCWLQPLRHLGAEGGGVMLLRITLPYACFGAVVDDATKCCTRVAPIGRWMIGKRVPEISNWVSSKGGIVERVS